MFKAKTLNDFTELQKVITELNKENIWKLELKIDKEYSECDLYVIDHTEELYYGGFMFESTLDKINSALRKDTDDTHAYFDCVCPGRWLADFKGRDPYDEHLMELDISIAIKEAMLRYMDDNGLEPHWTDELKDKFEDIPEVVVELIKEILK